MDRQCLREPIPEIEIAARRLNEAVSAHLRGERELAERLLREADDKIIWHWLDEAWGKTSIYNQKRRTLPPPVIPSSERAKPRQATPATKRLIHERDGYYCRFCKMPVIRAEVRSAIRRAYPSAVAWESANATQHAAFQCMWAQYDHILPHTRGGESGVENVYLTCAACNYGRGNALLEELDLLHPTRHACRRGDGMALSVFLVQPQRPL